jgi:hypothetical protein
MKGHNNTMNTAISQLNAIFLPVPQARLDRLNEDVRA